MKSIDLEPSMFLLILVSAVFCGKFVTVSYSGLGCAAGSEWMMMEYDFFSIMAAYAGSDDITITPDCYGVTAADYSFRFECVGGAYQYSMWSDSSTCSTPSPTVVSLATAPFDGSCLDAGFMSMKFQCELPITDGYAHFGIYKLGVSGCTGQPRDLLMSVYYKLNQCLDISGMGQMYVSTNGRNVRSRMYPTSATCQGRDFIEASWPEIGCLPGTLRRGIESSTMAFLGFGDDDSPTTTVIGGTGIVGVSMMCVAVLVALLF